MEGIKSAGPEVNSLIVKELGRDLTNLIINTLKDKNIELFNIKFNDIPKVALIVDKQLRGEIGFNHRRQLIKRMKIIKASNEIIVINQQPVSSRDTRREVEILIELGELERTTNDAKKSINTFRKAIQLADGINYPEKKVEAIIHLADAYSDLADWELAIKNYKNGLELAEETKNTLYKVKALHGLGSIKWTHGKLDDDKDYLDPGLILAEKHDLHEMAVNILNTLGMIATNEGNFEEGREFYERAIPLTDKIINETQSSMLYNNLGDIYLQLEQPEEAIKYFELCQKTAEVNFHEKWIAWSLLNKAEALTMIDDGDGCIEACNEAIPILKSIEDRYGLMSTYRNIALGYSLKDDWEKVDEYLKLGFDILDELKSPFQNAYFNYIWGKIEIKRGDNKKAAELLNQSRDIFDESKYTFYVELVEKILNKLEK